MTETTPKPGTEALELAAKYIRENFGSFASGESMASAMLDEVQQQAYTSHLDKHLEEMRDMTRATREMAKSTEKMAESIEKIASTVSNRCINIRKRG